MTIVADGTEVRKSARTTVSGVGLLRQVKPIKYRFGEKYCTTCSALSHITIHHRTRPQLLILLIVMMSIIIITIIIIITKNVCDLSRWKSAPTT